MIPKTLRRAAQLLDKHAELLREQHTMPDGRWRPSSREHRGDYYECLRLARQLRDDAKALPAATS